MTWASIDPNFGPQDLGFLRDILLPEDRRPVKEQLEDRYRHGGGYQPFDGFRLDRPTMTLRYPGDPPLKPAAMAQFGDETVFFYPKGSWLLILQKDGSSEVARVD